MIMLNRGEGDKSIFLVSYFKYLIFGLICFHLFNKENLGAFRICYKKLTNK